MNRIKKIVLSGIFVIAIYAALIAFPLQYLPLPGYRGIGEPISGGWRWGNSFGCFDDAPVLYFKGKDGFLVQEGEIIWKLFENLEMISKDGVFELKGALYPWSKSAVNAPRTPGSMKPRKVRVRYNDVGKILHMRAMYIDGVRVRDRAVLKTFILAQCGYPGLTVNLIRLFGIRQNWREPGRERGQEPGRDERRNHDDEPELIEMR